MRVLAKVWGGRLRRTWMRSSAGKSASMRLMFAAALWLSMAFSAYAQADPYAQAGSYAQAGPYAQAGSDPQGAQGPNPNAAPVRQALSPMRSPTALVLPAPSYVPPSPLPIGGVATWPAVALGLSYGNGRLGFGTAAGNGLFRNNPGNSNASGGSGNVRQQAVPLQGLALTGQPSRRRSPALNPSAITAYPSPISPYQYMYGPSRVAGVDNYNLMVRPMLEQRPPVFPGRRVWITRP